MHLCLVTVIILSVCSGLVSLPVPVQMPLYDDQNDIPNPLEQVQVAKERSLKMPIVPWRGTFGAFKLYNSFRQIPIDAFKILQYFGWWTDAPEQKPKPTPEPTSPRTNSKFVQLWLPILLTILLINILVWLVIKKGGIISILKRRNRKGNHRPRKWWSHKMKRFKRVLRLCTFTFGRCNVATNNLPNNSIESSTLFDDI